SAPGGHSSGVDCNDLHLEVTQVTSSKIPQPMRARKASLTSTRKATAPTATAVTTVSPVFFLRPLTVCLLDLIDPANLGALDVVVLLVFHGDYNGLVHEVLTEVFGQILDVLDVLDDQVVHLIAQALELELGHLDGLLREDDVVEQTTVVLPAVHVLGVLVHDLVLDRDHRVTGLGSLELELLCLGQHLGAVLEGLAATTRLYLDGAEV